jgi:hypothetical protein
MQQQITITYTGGEEVTYQVYPPDYAKWERSTGKSLPDFNGMYDLLFVTHSAYKREAGGKPTKTLDVWMESVINLEVGSDNPKAINEEV